MGLRSGTGWYRAWVPAVSLHGISDTLSGAGASPIHLLLTALGSVCSNGVWKSQDQTATFLSAGGVLDLERDSLGFPADVIADLWLGSG